jgi:hypothetical protein
MSLINDALRRAKQAQQESNPPPPAPGLRPIEPAPRSARHSAGVLLPVSLAAAAVLALLLLWRLSNRNSSTAATAQLSVAARPLTPQDATAPAPERPSQTAPVPSTVVPSLAVKKGSDALRETAVVPTEPSVAAAPHASAAVPGTSLTTAASETADTNGPALSEPAPAAPPPLKLQSIVFSPRRPSAMINGRVMFVGDKIRDLRVMMIRRDEVVLAGSGRTNVLSLEP